MNKKYKSEFISGINCVKDLRGESLHGLPSFGADWSPAAAGNKKYVIKFLGQLRRWERDQWLDIWYTFTCTHELSEITSRRIMTLVSRGNCQSNLKLNLPICDWALKKKKNPGEPWLWLYWVWCNGVTNSSACTQFLLPASHDTSETRYACSFCKRTRQIWGIWKLRLAYSPETPNLGQNRWCFVPCDLEIWRMTLENDRASLLCCFKLCATFHSHWWIQTGVTVRKRPFWVKFDDF